MTHARNSSALLLLALSATLLSAQEAISPAQTSNQITLDVVVTPKSGAPVAGLQKQDFTVLDNRVSQPITSFTAVSGSQEPVEVVLLIDAVNTSTTNISYERQQIDKFLRANGGNLAHPTSLAIFTDTGTSLSPGPSIDGNQISDALDHQTIGLREIRRSSGYYGAEDRLNLSLNALQLMASKEATHPGRKVILWISPGWPYLSGPATDLDNKQQQHLYSTVTNISTTLRRANITIYSVDSLGAEEGVGRELYYEQFVKGVSKPSQTQLGNLALQVLAIQTGGLALNASNDIAAQLERCVTDLKNYYEISFTAPPSEHPGEYHQLEIKLDQPGLTAHTRTGYYSMSTPGVSPDPQP